MKWFRNKLKATNLDTPFFNWKFETQVKILSGDYDHGTVAMKLRKYRQFSCKFLNITNIEDLLNKIIPVRVEDFRDGILYLYSLNSTMDVLRASTRLEPIKSPSTPTETDPLTDPLTIDKTESSIGPLKTFDPPEKTTLTPPSTRSNSPTSPRSSIGDLPEIRPEDSVSCVDSCTPPVLPRHNPVHQRSAINALYL